MGLRGSAAGADIARFGEARSLLSVAPTITDATVLSSSTALRRSIRRFAYPVSWWPEFDIYAVTR
jgi:hypothetical protein